MLGLGCVGYMTETRPSWNFPYYYCLQIFVPALDYSLERLDLSHMPRLLCTMIVPGLADADNSTPSNSWRRLNHRFRKLLRGERQSA